MLILFELLLIWTYGVLIGVTMDYSYLSSLSSRTGGVTAMLSMFLLCYCNGICCFWLLFLPGLVLVLCIMLLIVASVPCEIFDFIAFVVLSLPVWHSSSFSGIWSAVWSLHVSFPPTGEFHMKNKIARLVFWTYIIM